MGLKNGLGILVKVQKVNWTLDRVPSMLNIPTMVCHAGMPYFIVHAEGKLQTEAINKTGATTTK